ncbi:DUF4386 family protein, partial [Candidatus Dojkabacteria bacterium]|nr:DUF4386 family protein [Candidatus Dojkabacteria bacterium]
MSYKINARLAGAFFLIAMFASLAGAFILEQIITEDNYLLEISENKQTFAIGMILEMINALCVIGIAVTLYPVLKKTSETGAIGYVAIRILEVLAAIMGVVGALSLRAL